MKFLSGLVFGLAFFASTAFAQNAKPTPVNVHNFVRAETDRYFGKTAIGDGAFGKLRHRREMASIDKQDVVRMNRDTLYSSGVFDLDASPVTITLPDAGKRFMSMQVVSQDHYTTEVAYGPGSFTYTKDKVGTRYVFIIIRTLADSDRPAGREGGECRAGCDQGGAGQRRQVRGAELGPGVADQGAGCA